VSDERIIEMTWRCSGCQRQNLGRYKNCQGCGNPKDESEEFDMPSDTAAAESVTDAEQLRAANAGEDWRCPFCGGDQRRDDRRCANCGASADQAVAPEPEPEAPPAPRKRRWKLKTVLGLAAASIAGLVWNAQRPRDYRGTVSAVAWEQIIEVERYAIRAHEGFREVMPSSALNVKSLGRRLHHMEQVLDHYDTEHYSVREACGEDCTDVPETCREKCTSNKNGYASCRQVCSGGGRRCRTRYCSSTRTRQVARYRQEPRYAEAVAYNVWEWATDRTLKETGTDPTELAWPKEGARTAGLNAGEQERERRRAKYVVTLQYANSQPIRFEIADPARFARFKTGTTHDVHREYGRITVDGMAITPLK
jgi:hypothetical protein